MLSTRHPAPAPGTGTRHRNLRGFHAVDPDLPVYHVQTVDALVHRSMSVQQFATLLLTAFAATALVLALVGISGVMWAPVARTLRVIDPASAVRSE